MDLQKPIAAVHPKWMLLVALLLGWSFDILFWGRQIGISFPLYAILCLAGGLGIVQISRQTTRRRALFLIIPILFFAIMVFMRSEPLTVFLDILFTVAFLALLADTATTGRWLQYGLMDYGQSFAQVCVAAFLRPLMYPWRNLPAGPAGEKDRGFWKVLPYLRGLLLAFPFFLFFACLLAAADPVFSARLQQIFNIEKIPEYIFRLSLIAFLSYLMIGVFLHALSRNAVEAPLYSEKGKAPVFLGSVESTIVYIVVNLLFLSFVAVQFQYLFGGESNVHIDGFTYAEYARRGFWELIAVAVFSLLMFLVLHGITKRPTVAERWVFSGLAAAQMILVQVILYSAFVRLNLYEAAYGFSRLRTYAHVFLVWIAILFLIVIVLDLLQRTRRIGLLFTLAAVGFAVSLNALNVDAFIVRENIRRASEGEGLDNAYLGSLSADAVPALKESFLHEATPVKFEIGASLACYAANGAEQPYDSAWQAFHWGRFQAKEDILSMQGALADYAVVAGAQGSIVVRRQGVEYSCGRPFWDLE
jgi:hypothetical protein